MYLTHYNTVEGAEAYLMEQGFVEIALNTWQDDCGIKATLTPFHHSIVYVQFI